MRNPLRAAVAAGLKLGSSTAKASGLRGNTSGTQPRSPEPGISFYQGLGVLAAHILLLVALLTLLALTIRNNGFARTPLTKNDFLDSVGMEWSILWQSLPPFIISLFALCRNWLVDEALHHISRADIENSARGVKDASLLLILKNPSPNRTFNYLERLMPSRPWHAFRNGDLNLATALVLSIFVTFVLQPLMASLIAPQESTFLSPVTVQHLVSFNRSRLSSLTPSQWNLITDSTTAEVLHTGAPAPWTNGTHAFLPFSPATPIQRDGERVTLSAPSTAYAAHLSCTRLSTFNLTLDDLGRRTGFFQARITATDRSCAISYMFTFSPVLRPLVVEAFHQKACGLANGITRILVLTATATFDNSTETASMADTALISCIAGYSATPGELTVSWPPPEAAAAGNGTTNTTADTDPMFVGFVATEPVVPTKDFSHELFEEDLLGLQEVQWGSLNEGAASTKMAQFALGIAAERRLERGEEEKSANETALAVIHDPALLEDALPLAFASIYRVAVAREGVVPNTADVDGEGVMGRLETVETRLFALIEYHHNYLGKWTLLTCPVGSCSCLSAVDPLPIMIHLPTYDDNVFGTNVEVATEAEVAQHAHVFVVMAGAVWASNSSFPTGYPVVESTGIRVSPCDGF
ncbi:hypothetical protein N656DRAFT_771691 [Canariomyces notabilis]|uniref:Uncharacterized protein n=1 Tax=Canariomyces notabilis TaxID=2074819 RepID=A0AAN6QE21_9PEZI|nr:hypothetical protein N656DRAFT_771691 [Canariomyces arenarius]